MQPSKYQQGVIDWVIKGSGNAMVDAVAGSGKTTLLVMCAEQIRGDGLFVAFNKSIATELQKRLQHTSMTARTIHSLGYGMLARTLSGKMQVDDSKYYTIAKRFMEKLPKDEWKGFISAAMKLAQLARLNLIEMKTPEGLIALCEHHGMDINPHAIKAVPLMIEQGNQLAQNAGVIDFTDMVYLPVLWGLNPKQYQWVFIDEAQDLNACQLEVVLRASAAGGRMLFVGDKRQAIYGFAGADHASYANIKARTNSVELPLSICYRCPTNHLDLARAIVPQIEARDDAPAGSIEYISLEHFDQYVQEGDLVLCRTTAPLVKECITLIQKQIPARVKGREIGKGLTAILRKVQGAKDIWFKFEELPAYLNEYQAAQLTKLAARENTESQAEALIDKIACLQTCYQAMDATSLDELAGRIEALFSDNRSSVWFSTVHRAKGLENNRIFILHPDKLPLTWKNQQEWQLEQEMNLKYVALTRSTDVLYFVFDPESDTIPDDAQSRIAISARLIAPEVKTGQTGATERALDELEDDAFSHVDPTLDKRLQKRGYAYPELRGLE